MALILNFEVPPTSDIPRQSRDCRIFKFYDTTGKYNASTNPGGYGTPNPPVNTITGASVDITPYLKDTTYNAILFSTLIPFPNTDGFPAIVANTSFGLSTSQPIPSGIYSMVYHVGDGINTYSSEPKNIYLDCLHQCCADKLMAKWASGNCGCEGEEAREELLDLAIRAQGTIIAIHKALQPDCPKLTEAQNLVNWLNATCDKTGCGCN